MSAIKNQYFQLLEEQAEWNVHNAHHTSPQVDPQDFPECQFCKEWIEMGVHDHARQDELDSTVRQEEDYEA